MKPRRKYKPGRCQDCGRETNVTTVIFWASGVKMDYCPRCIKPYRSVINKPGETVYYSLSDLKE